VQVNRDRIIDLSNRFFSDTVVPATPKEDAGQVVFAIYTVYTMRMATTITNTIKP
jgi:hypothetical protein